MKFHVGSFALGWLTGVATASMVGRLRPILVELAGAGFHFSDTLATRIALGREEIEDFIAEAKARARERTHAREPKRAPRREPRRETARMRVH